MNIVEFLEARISEDEAVARQSSNPIHEADWGDPWEEDLLAEKRYDNQPHGRNCGWKLGEGMRDDCTCMWPARVLAECAAKRRIVEECAPNVAKDWPFPDGLNLSEFVVAELVQPYADHPDFDPAWR